MAAFNRTARTSNPLATASRARMDVHGIEIVSGKYCSGNPDAGVFPRFVTRFRDADGTLFTHIGSARRVADAEGRKAWVGPASLVPGASVALRVDGITVSGTDAEVGHIVTSVRPLKVATA